MSEQSDGPAFYLHASFGLEKSRAREFEHFLVTTMKSTQSIPKTINAVIKAKSIHSIKPLSKKERDYLLILLGIYVKTNQFMHEAKILQSLNPSSPLSDSDSATEYDDGMDGMEGGG